MKSRPRASVNPVTKSNISPVFSWSSSIKLRRYFTAFNPAPPRGPRTLLLQRKIPGHEHIQPGPVESRDRLMRVLHNRLAPDIEARVEYRLNAGAPAHFAN